MKIRRKERIRGKKEGRKKKEGAEEDRAGKGRGGEEMHGAAFHWSCDPVNSSACP